MSALLPLEQALQRVLAAANPAVASEAIPLLQARGRVLARDLVSTLDVPAADNSAMDGYALRAADAGERLVVAPEISVELMAALRAGDATALAPLLSNDLQDAALTMAPHLRETIAAAEGAGALAAIVSGSGPTVAALAGSRQHALAVAAGITASGTATATLVADGPADGAVLVDQPAGRRG